MLLGPAGMIPYCTIIIALNVQHSTSTVYRNIDSGQGSSQPDYYGDPFYISSYVSLYIRSACRRIGETSYSQSADWFNEVQVNVMVDRRDCIRELCTVDRCLIISMSV